MTLILIKSENVKRATPRYKELVSLLTKLVNAEAGPVLNACETHRNTAKFMMTHIACLASLIFFAIGSLNIKRHSVRIN